MSFKFKTLLLGTMFATTTIMSVPTASAWGTNCQAEQEEYSQAVTDLIAVSLDPSSSEEEIENARNDVKETFADYSKCAFMTN